MATCSHAPSKPSGAARLPAELLVKIFGHMLSGPLNLAEQLPEKGVGGHSPLDAVPLPARVFAPIGVAHFFRDAARKDVLSWTKWHVDTVPRAHGLPPPGQWNLPPKGAMVTINWSINKAGLATIARERAKLLRKPNFGCGSHDRGEHMYRWFRKTDLADSIKQWELVARYARGLLAGRELGQLIMDGRRLERHDVPGLETGVGVKITQAGLAEELNEPYWEGRVKVRGYAGMEANCLNPALEG